MKRWRSSEAIPGHSFSLGLECSLALEPTSTRPNGSVTVVGMRRNGSDLHLDTNSDLDGAVDFHFPLDQASISLALYAFRPGEIATSSGNVPLRRIRYLVQRLSVVILRQSASFMKLLILVSSMDAPVFIEQNDHTRNRLKQQFRLSRRNGSTKSQ